MSPRKLFTLCYCSQQYAQDQSIPKRLYLIKMKNNTVLAWHEGRSQRALPGFEADTASCDTYRSDLLANVRRAARQLLCSARQFCASSSRHHFPELRSSCSRPLGAYEDPSDVALSRRLCGEWEEQPTCAKPDGQGEPRWIPGRDGERAQLFSLVARHYGYGKHPT